MQTKQDSREPSHLVCCHESFVLASPHQSRTSADRLSIWIRQVILRVIGLRMSGCGIVTILNRCGEAIFTEANFLSPMLQPWNFRELLTDQRSSKNLHRCEACQSRCQYPCYQTCRTKSQTKDLSRVTGSPLAQWVHHSTLCCSQQVTTLSRKQLETTAGFEAGRRIVV